MKKEQFYELLGEVDDKQVKNAETTPLGKSKVKWIGLGVSVAACFIILFGVLMWHTLSTNIITDNSGVSSSESSDPYSRDIEIEHDNIDIYYLDNNEIKCVSEFLPCDPQVIFESWKSHNGIGDEVKLIKVKIDNNGTEYSDSSIAYYSAGDYYSYNAFITANLKDYYKTIPEKELLNSLEFTLKGYLNIECNEFNIVFE